MNKSIIRMLIGVAFIGLGVYRLTAQNGGQEWISYLAIAYGIFSIGMGLYFKNKQNKE